LVPQPQPLYETFKQFIVDLGFNVVEMSPQMHDDLIGLASHLPYVMAVTTVLATSHLPESERAILKQVLGPGFRDTTRVASADPLWGRAVCEQNRDALVKSLKEAHAILGNLIERVTLSQGDYFEAAFRQAQSTRNRFFS
jgi:prephenate dehydrogenase